MITIVAEGAQHRSQVRAVNRNAFGGDFEADLVDALRAAGLVAGSLVAVSGGAVAGHILFSDLAVTMDGRAVPAVALAPMAVRPALQRRGIGTGLVRAGLAAVQRRGRTAAIGLGHPAYYERFGFSAALAERLAAPYGGRAFMALELVPGALAGTSGTVRYPDAFTPPR